jgi:hypothetical protein
MRAVDDAARPGKRRQSLLITLTWRPVPLPDISSAGGADQPETLGRDADPSGHPPRKSSRSLSMPSPNTTPPWSRPEVTSNRSPLSRVPSVMPAAYVADGQASRMKKKRGDQAGGGDASRLSLRQPPARLFAMICRNIVTRARSLIFSSRRTAIVRPVSFP